MIHKDADLLRGNDDLGISRWRVIFSDLPSGELDNEEYLLNVLNKEQKQVFYHIIHSVKTSSEPFYIFLSGGAGCGKSKVIKAIYQGLLKYFSHKHGEDPATLKIIMSAPTGKTSDNICGSAIHSAFCIPASQGFQFKPLTCSSSILCVLDIMT